MNRELQSRCWQCLPKEARNHIRSDYEYYLKRYEAVKANTAKGAIDALEDLFGSHNLTSDTDPEEMLMVSRKQVLSEICRAENLQNDKEEDWIRAGEEIEFTLNNLFGDKCLPDKLSVQAEPKFEVGDKVRIIIEGWQRDPLSEVIYYDEGDNTYKLDALNCEEGGLWVKEWQIEPYTEPESRNLSQEIANCDKSEDNQLKDNMEEKELNLAELLKGCEGGIYLCPTRKEPIIVEHTAEGCKVVPEEDVKKLISRFTVNPDFYAAWMEWKESRKPWSPVLGDEYYSVSGCAKVIKLKYLDNAIDAELERIHNRFRTEEEAQQAAEAVRETLMKFHENQSKQ